MEIVISLAVIILLILTVCASASVGVYLRRRLEYGALMHITRRPYIGIGVVILSLTLTISFALAGLYGHLLAAIFVSSASLAALIWNEVSTR